MITRIEARAYRCLRAVDQDLGAFRALVGPNGSGKSTFLDVIGLLSDVMRSRGQVVDSVHARSSDFEKLVWKGEGSSFELAVEAAIPQRVRAQMAEDKQHFDHVRYQIETCSRAAFKHSSSIA